MARGPGDRPGRRARAAPHGADPHPALSGQPLRGASIRRAHRLPPDTRGEFLLDRVRLPGQKTPAGGLWR